MFRDPNLIESCYIAVAIFVIIFIIISSISSSSSNSSSITFSLSLLLCIIRVWRCRWWDLSTCPKWCHHPGASLPTWRTSLQRLRQLRSLSSQSDRSNKFPGCRKLPPETTTTNQPECRRRTTPIPNNNSSNNNNNNRRTSSASSVVTRVPVNITDSSRARDARVSSNVPFAGIWRTRVGAAGTAPSTNTTGTSVNIAGLKNASRSACGGKVCTSVSIYNYPHDVIYLFEIILYWGRKSHGHAMHGYGAHLGTCMCYKQFKLSLSSGPPIKTDRIFDDLNWDTRGGTEFEEGLVNESINFFKQNKHAENWMTLAFMHYPVHARSGACMTQCMHGPVHAWSGACMIRGMHGPVHAWSRACMVRCMHGPVHAWSNACTVLCMHDPVNAWSGACMVACMLAWIFWGLIHL